MLLVPVTFWGGAGSRTYETTTSSTGGGPTYNFTSIPLGSAQGTSLVVVIAFGADSTGTAGETLSSASIAGVGATINIKTQTNNTGAGNAAVAIVSAVTSSTTGTVSLTFSHTFVVAGISVYRLNNLNSTTPTATTSAATPSGSTGTSVSSTINIPSNGILIQGLASDNIAPSVVGSSNDATIANNILKGWAGSNDSLAAQTGRTVSATFSASIVSMVAAAWN